MPIESSAAPVDASAHTLPLQDGRSVALALLPFDAGAFDPRAFATHGIACPPAIARSVLTRQAAFFHGRMAARQALAPFGLDRWEIAIGPLREPVWPPGFAGSISHNDRYAAAVALPAARGIGIDLETVIEPGLCDVLVATAVNPAERLYLQALCGPASFAWLLTIVFSAKESFYKAAFPTARRFFDFSAVEVSALDVATGTIAFVVKEHLGGALQAGTRHDARFFMLDRQTVCTSCHLA